MLLKFLPRERCLMERFLANHTSRVDRSESRPGGIRKENMRGWSLLKFSSCRIPQIFESGLKSSVTVWFNIRMLSPTVVRDIQAGDVWDLCYTTLKDLRSSWSQLERQGGGDFKLTVHQTQTHLRTFTGIKSDGERPTGVFRWNVQLKMESLRN